MALPFFNGANKTRDQVVSIDLGGRTTKAVHLQRKGERYALTRYALLDAPIYEKSMGAELLGEHLKAVTEVLDPKTRTVTLAIGVQDSVVRHTELPLMPLGDMRNVLKNNTKSYLQQDLPGHVFDCSPLQTNAPARVADKTKPVSGTPKVKVLVAGARQQLLNEIQTAAKSNGLSPDCIVPGLIGPVNAFELAMPEIFGREVIALIDIGFKNTTICLVQEGELVLSRVVAIGGDRLTAGLAESLGISYAEAEGIKVGMPTEVQSNLEALVVPLGRELRASIDFFEHQQDKAIGQVFVTGGSARSDFILRVLQTELMMECRPWSPLSFLELELQPEQTAEIDHVAPQLAVAIGTAMAA